MSRALSYAGIGCGFLALCALCITSVSCYAVLPTPARDAAQGFLADVRDSNWSGALQRTSAEYTRTHDAYALQRAVQDFPRLRDHTSATFYNASIDDDRATLDGTIVAPDGDLPIAVELVEVDGYWYVDAVVIQGEPLE